MNRVNLHGMTLKLNIRIFILTVGLLSSVVLSAQTHLQRMEKDPKAGAGIYCPYSYDAVSEASKPEGGYKPFYISHFGRHGSRYFSRPMTWQSAIDFLKLHMLRESSQRKVNRCMRL